MRNYFPSKYHNTKVTVGGERFDSKKEAERWWELQLLERAGEIRDLQRQVRFELIPTQRTKSGKKVPPTYYIADFTYTTRAGQKTVEDVKGIRTDVYKLKKKLMLYRHGIEIQEV